MKQASNVLIIIIMMLLINIIIGGVIYYQQNQLDVDDSLIVQKEGGVVVEDETISDAGLEEADNISEEAHIKSEIDCKTIGDTWQLFSDKNTTLSFCYNSAWGVPVFGETGIDPEARIGTAYNVSFPRMGNGDYLLISYSTLDFQKTGARDSGEMFDWNKLDFNKSDNELARLLPYDDNPMGDKIRINNKQALKVSRKYPALMGDVILETVDYFVPKVIINEKVYNLHISTTQNKQIEVDKLVKTVTF